MAHVSTTRAGARPAAGTSTIGPAVAAEARTVGIARINPTVGIERIGRVA